MKVSTFNICGAINSSRRLYGRWGPLVKYNQERATIARLTLERIKEFVKEEGVDILALQEIDRSGIDQPQELARLTSMNYVYGPNFNYNLCGLLNVDTGNGVFSREVIKNSFQIQFSTNQWSPLRKLKGSKKLLVIQDQRGIYYTSVHLTHNDDSQKLLEVRELFNYCRDHTPIILMGDLNFMPRPQRLRSYSNKRMYATDTCPEVIDELIADFGLDVQIGEGLVSDDPRLYTTGNPLDKTIDYIAVINKPEDKVKPKLVSTYRVELGISDHEPLVAEIQL